VLTKFRQDLQFKLCQDGLVGTVRWLVRYLMTVPYEHIDFEVFVRSLEEPLPVAQPRIPIAMRLATEADLPRFRDLVLPSEYRHLARRLAHGRFCFLAFPAANPERLVAYRWAAVEISPDIDALILDLPKGYAYIDDSYTVPAYRRRGIQIALFSFCLEYLRTLGCKRVVAIVGVKNEASRKLMTRELGYREAGRTSFRRILRTVVTPLAIELPED
jgi:GNAT superfamily N-acetyltransferase